MCCSFCNKQRGSGGFYLAPGGGGGRGGGRRKRGAAAATAGGGGQKAEEWEELRRVVRTFHWERGTHQVNIHELSPSPAETHASLSSQSDLPVTRPKDTHFEATPGGLPKRGSMPTLRGSPRRVWSWRGGMYRFFVKLTFLIPAIVISQGNEKDSELSTRRLQRAPLTRT